MSTSSGARVPTKRPASLVSVSVAAIACLMLVACAPGSTGSGGTGGRTAGSGGSGAGGAQAPTGTGGAGSGGVSGSGGDGSGGVQGGAGGRMGSGGSGSGGAAGGGGERAGGANGATGGAAGRGGAPGGTGGAGGTLTTDAGVPGDGGTERPEQPDASSGTALAAALDKFRLECPCKPAAADHTSDGNCNVTPQTDRQTIEKTMGGDPGTTYDVTLRVRGLTEPNTYRNGMLQGQRFYIGGTTSAAGYTSFMMTVAQPAQHYFFNYNSSVGHTHFLLDYQVTVKIRGGSKVTFEINGDGSVPDGHQVSNADHLVVPDVPPAPMWYDGQFVQLDVVSVQPSP